MPREFLKQEVKTVVSPKSETVVLTGGQPTITSNGAIIRGNQDLANSAGYKDAIAEIKRIRESNRR